MVGIKPVPDALGRVNKLEVIPLEELGRPRVDVVVNCSGVFRDLFVNQMNLLDRAVKMAAELDEPDEMNFVRKHAKKQVSSPVSPASCSQYNRSVYIYKPMQLELMYSIIGTSTSSCRRHTSGLHNLHLSLH